MTYTKKNIQSAFEATGIVPLNKRQVLSHKKCTTGAHIQQPPTKAEFQVPRTPSQGRSILIHGRKRRNTFPNLPLKVSIHIV